jgi:hypothetical protein
MCTARPDGQIFTDGEQVVQHVFLKYHPDDFPISCAFRLWSKPPTVHVPPSKSRNVHKILIVVDLPAPFGPRKENNFPCST